MLKKYFKQQNLFVDFLNIIIYKKQKNTNQKIQQDLF